jgi:hypothetical protein
MFVAPGKRRPLRKVSKSDGAVLYFEVLTEVNSANGTAGPFRILAYRTYS